eukprot:TRINITY_DN731_c0_g1_i2.p2 TRINITY_DN731_c0_g1~~TRINITY_DN731_c0_g1_i2.p2  ORF type:complete len:143 (+),score=48.74 TRINITY_DN731_c0_g1_i2:16-444(+)
MWWLLWVISFVIAVLALFLAIYLLVHLVDLENDEINPIDMCYRVNAAILPEYICQWTIFALMFFTGHWLEALLLLPIAAYHAKRFFTNTFKFDPTKVYNVLQFEKKFAFGRVFFYMAVFFIFIVRFVFSLVKVPKGRSFSLF